MQCPATIAVNQKITNSPAGWTAGYNGFTNELASLTVYYGPPEEGASLVYNDEKTLADSVTQTWQLTPNERGESITCRYSNTSGQLAQKILADVTRYEVPFEPTSALATGALQSAWPSAHRLIPMRPARLTSVNLNVR